MGKAPLFGLAVLYNISVRQGSLYTNYIKRGQGYEK